MGAKTIPAISSAESSSPHEHPAWLRERPGGLLLSGIAIAYVLFAWMGWAVATTDPSSSPVWPATGLAMAAVVLVGYRAGWAVFAGAFLANALATGPTIVSAAIALGNTAEALLGGFLILRYANGKKCFSALTCIVRFAVLAGLGATTVSATVGTASIVWGGFVDPSTAPAVWLTWWLGHVAGALVIAPFLIVWLRPPRPSFTATLSRPGFAVQCVLLCASLLVLSVIIFALSPILDSRRTLTTFLFFPIVVWAAFLSGQRGATLVTVGLSIIAVASTSVGHGPFAGRSQGEPLLLLETFLATLAMLGLLAAVVIADRDRAVEDMRRLRDGLAQRVTRRTAALADSEERFRLLVEGTRDYAIYMLDPQGRIMTWNEGARRMKGWTEAEVIGKHASIVHSPEDVAAGRPERLLQAAAERGRVEEELVLVRNDGSRFVAEIVLTALRDVHGGLRGYSNIARDVTARYEAEAALRARAHALDEAQRIAHVGSWELDMARNELLGSPEMFRLLGLRDDVGRHSFDDAAALLDSAHKEIAQTAVTKAIADAEPFAFEALVHRPAAGDVWLHMEGRPVKENGGSRIVGTAQDITERKFLEGRLEASAERFHALAENAQDSIVSAGASGEIAYLNRAARDLFGYTTEEAVGQPLTILMPERFHAAHQAGLRRFIEGGAPRMMGRVVEFAGRRKDGSEFPLELSLGSWRSGNEPRFIGIMRDITDRKRAEALLRESLERFETLAEGSPLGVFHTNAQGTFDYANRQWIEIMGVNYGDREAIQAAIHPEDRDMLAAKWEWALKTGTEFIANFRVRRAEGGFTSCATRASPVRDATLGRVNGFVGYLQDVTESTLAREIVQRAQAAEIQHLREMNAFRVQFINTAAHELRTPLVPLRSQILLLRAQMGTTTRKEERESLDIVERNLERLADLVEDLLESARYQAGTVSLDLRATDVHEVVREAVESFQAAARARNVRLALAVAGDRGAIIDAKRITQVLFNLLSNALKFTPERGNIRVSCAGNGTVDITVTDDGRGIDPDDLRKLFQPFSQVGYRRDLVDPGSGLGLYVSKAIIEAHGGSIEATSQGLGRGATVRFSVPRTPPSTSPPASATDPTSAGPSTSTV